MKNPKLTLMALLRWEGDGTEMRPLGEHPEGSTLGIAH